MQEPGSHHRTSYIDSPAALEEARKDRAIKHSGPLSDYYLSQMIAYLKCNKASASPEFESLDSKDQHFLQAETKPFYEIISVSALSFALEWQIKLPPSLEILFCGYVIAKKVSTVLKDIL